MIEPASLAEIEAGEKPPTRAQLSRLAEIYRRPLTVLYLDEPPPERTVGEDFRSRGTHTTKVEEGLLQTLIRDIKARQSMVKSLLEDEDEAIPRAYVGCVGFGVSVDYVAQNIAAELRYVPGEGRGSDPEALFKHLRKKTEAIGIFVVLVADLGNHHSAIKSNVFRGFAIADRIAPFVVINAQDAVSSRAFTLIHELAHIWLGRTGISGMPHMIEGTGDHERLEEFCNDVAGQFLLPNEYLAHLHKDDFSEKEVAMQRTAQISKQMSVSEPMVAYKLTRIDLMPHRIYKLVAAEYAKRWMSRKNTEEPKAKEIGGPNYYTVKKSRLGDSLFNLVLRSYDGRGLSPTKAAKILGVNPANVNALLHPYSRAGSN